MVSWKTSTFPSQQQQQATSVGSIGNIEDKVKDCFILGQFLNDTSNVAAATTTATTAAAVTYNHSCTIGADGDNGLFFV